MELKCLYILLALLVFRGFSLDLTIYCYNKTQTGEFSCEAGKAIAPHSDENSISTCGEGEKCIDKANEVIQIGYYNPSAVVTFPSQIFDQWSSLEKVTLEKMEIPDFSMEHLKYARKLKDLSLAGNKIKFISANVISMAPALERLNLNKNEIDDIEDGAFTSSTLKYLELRRNELTSLKRGTWLGAPNLEEIYLSDNFIESIEDGTFDLPNIELIELGHNQLKTLPGDLFAKTPKLSKLNLNFNRLGEILSTVEKASKLEVLQLNGNPSMKEQILPSLDRLPQLKQLFVSNANQSLLISFRPHKLKSLAISSNNLRNTGLLDQLKVLEDLDTLTIEYNQLLKLDNFNKIREYFPKLTKIRLEGNKWNCDWVVLAREVCLSIQCFGLSKYDLYANGVMCD